MQGAGHQRREILPRLRRADGRPLCRVQGAPSLPLREILRRVREATDIELPQMHRSTRGRREILRRLWQSRLESHELTRHSARGNGNGPGNRRGR